MPAKDIKLLYVRLPAAEKRHIKSLAAREGLTLRQTLQQAVAAWELQLQSRDRGADPGPGTFVAADLEKRGQPLRAAKSSAGSRRVTDAESSRENWRDAGAKSMDGEPQQREAPSPAVLRQAAQLDWSKCPEAQRVAGKDGNVWVVRGTRVPVSAVLDALAEGYPPGDVAEVFEFSLPRLIAILRFAVQSAPPGTSGQ